MKICAEGTEGLYPKHCPSWGPATVFLDGKEVRGFQAVDTSTGVGWRAKLDANGNIVVRGDEFVMERVFGSFKVSGRVPIRGKLVDLVQFP